MDPDTRNGADSLADYTDLTLEEEKRLAGYDISIYEKPAQFTPKKRKHPNASGNSLLEAVEEAEENIKKKKKSTQYSLPALSGPPASPDSPAPPAGTPKRGRTAGGRFKKGGTGGRARRGGKK